MGVARAPPLTHFSYAPVSIVLLVGRAPVTDEGSSAWRSLKWKSESSHVPLNPTLRAGTLATFSFAVECTTTDGRLRSWARARAQRDQRDAVSCDLFNSVVLSAGGTFPGARVSRGARAAPLKR
ncbi:hypothetical protein EVAR_79252_1 [Eumeta japonica]|uniref:Uncharacterized protein n=1 Tax=Eumeta variegata TaxID=151549 RepID=A0A4C1TED8_EUMVA|nr:hypothetical protein EVAR_79252_1 [Eumeta japonica]